MSTTPANWYPDPVNRHQMRYWDGANWTEHVSDDGVAGVDPIQAGAGPAQAQVTGLDRIDSALTIGKQVDPAKIANQVSATGHKGAGVTGAAFQGGGTLFTESILVVNQKAKLIELNNQYTVFNSAGQQIGAVNEVGQSKAKKALRLLSNLDQYMTHKLLISDANGAPILQITRPAKVFKSTVIVSDPAGNEIGKIVQDNVFGKIHFTLEAGGQTLGSINAENWRAWNFRIDDHNGQEVARITKTFEGIAKAVFTTADNYVVQMHTQLPQPFLSLVVAAACSVDTALKQDDR